MSREVRPTRQYKRDYKRIRHDRDLVCELNRVIDDLAADVPLDASKRDHDLHGDWEGCRECHVRPDALLIYSKEDGGLRVLALERFGSHSSLFG